MPLVDLSTVSGYHCETTTIGNLLLCQGICISEPMMFGIGEGLQFIYFDSKNLAIPFLGGRSKPGQITEKLTQNLGLKLETKISSSRKKAWENVKKYLDAGVPVGLKLDQYHLEYTNEPIHFAAHYVTIYGYDDKYAYLIDTMDMGGVQKTSLASLQQARDQKGPMSSRNLSFTIFKTEKLPEMRNVLISAIQRNACEYLNPPISNISYRGIEKASKEVKKWFERCRNVQNDLNTISMLMEFGGTGGAAFRNLYCDFLKESLRMVDDKNIRKGYEIFSKIAPLWTEVASVIKKAGDSGSQSYLDEASNLFQKIALLEYEAMTKLSKVGL